MTPIFGQSFEVEPAKWIIEFSLSKKTGKKSTE